MNFARDVVEAAPPARRAMVALGRDGTPPRVAMGEIAEPAADALAAALDALGVRRGDVVLTLLGNRPEWVLTMIACFRQGYVVLPCTEQLRAERPAAPARGRPAARSSSATSATPASWPPPAGTAPTLWVPLGRSCPRRAAPAPAELAPGRPVPDHVHVRHRGRAQGRPARPALPRRPAAPGRALARCPRRTSSSGARPRPAGRSRPATRSSRPGCAAPRRCCTTPASTPASGSSCSSASAWPSSAWRRPSTA